VKHRGKHLVHGVSFGEIMVKVSFHKHGASVADHGRFLILAPFGIVRQWTTQLLGQLFNKTACACRTYVIHRREGDPAAFQGGELGVLASDLNDRIHVRIDLDGRPSMGRYLIHNEIGAHDLSCKFSSRPGRGSARNGQRDVFSCRDILNGCKDSLDRSDGSPGGAGVGARKDRTVGG